MKLNQFQHYCETLPEAAADFPFGEETLVYKIRGKLFVLTGFNDFSYISVKCDPDDVELFRRAFSAVTPGYHLNKRHWITMRLDGGLSDEFLFSRILDSYYLVSKRGRGASLPSGIDLAKAGRFIADACEPLYGALFDYHFSGGSAAAVCETLVRYQNDDGGFGHGLEPDFLTPESSPMATSVAFQILEEVGAEGEEYPRAAEAIDYLESTYDPARGGWYAVSKAVNASPHAPWWNWDEATEMTVIDRHWGNPTAELLAGIRRFRALSKAWSADVLEEKIEDAVDRLTAKEEFPSPHEIYCYIRLYHTIGEDLPAAARRMEEPLAAAVESLMRTDPAQWSTYQPRPLDFVSDPSSPLFASVRAYAALQCRYLVETVEDGIWRPHWSWGEAYPEAWRNSRDNWTARLTINNYILLRRFGFLPPEASTIPRSEV